MSINQDPFERAACVHIYGQWDNHCEAIIRGNAAGLAALRNAIDAAIKGGKAEAKIMTNDGEGYGVRIERVGLASSCGKVPYVQHLAWELAAKDREAENSWKKRSGK